MHILIDTGAHGSFISEEASRRIHHSVIGSRNKKHWLADGITPFETNGTIELNIRIGHMNTTITGSIAKSLTCDCILGADWIYKYSVAILTHENRVALHGRNGTEIASQPIDQGKQKFRYFLSALHTVILRPYEELLVDAQAPISSPSSTIYYPWYSRRTDSHSGGALTIKNYRTQVRLTNCSNRPFCIRARSHIGIIECANPIVDSSILHAIDKSSNEPQSDSSTRVAIDKLVSHLVLSQEKRRVQAILHKYEQLFDIATPTVAKTSMSHAIRTGDVHPISERPRAQSLFQREETKKHVTAMLSAGQIEHSNSPWAAPVHIVKKPDGSTRFTVDYRKLNEMTIKDSYPLPVIGDTIGRLGGHCYFTKMDLKSGYLQIPIREEDKPKTAFITKDGLFQFNVLPAGLKNAPPGFQRIMNAIVVEGRDHFCLVYLDDIIIFSKSFDEHLRHVEEVLSVLHRHHFQLNSTKCDFFKPKMNYLGHTIDSNGVMPLDDKIEAIKQLAMPTTLKQANHFIGALGFYRKFIKGFAAIAAPIHRVTNLHKGHHKEFVWGDEQAEAFYRLKTIISSNLLVLDFPDDTSPLILSTDASDVGIGGVLKQQTPDGLRFIYYHSQVLNEAQKKYSTIEKEALAVTKCVEKFRPYLLGRDFLIETDHCPLCNFHKKSVKNRRVDNWSLILSEYNITGVIYKKGKCNCDADLVSRHPIGEPDDEQDENSGHCPPIRRFCVNAMTRAATRRLLLPLPLSSSATAQVTSSKNSSVGCEKISPTIDTCLEDPTSSDPIDTSSSPRLKIKISPLEWNRIKEEQATDETIQSYIKQPPLEAAVNNGILFQRRTIKGVERLVPYLPVSLVPEVLAAAHDHPLSAHFGRDRTFDKLKQRCYWPGMYASIKKYIRTCPECARFNIRRQKLPGHLNPIDPPDEIFKMVGLDYWGPTPIQSNNGNRYVLVLTDYLSKFVVAKALPSATAQAAAEFIVETALTFGVPSLLLSDNGTHFNNELFQCLSSTLGFKHVLSTPYHPQTNGQTERWNATMRPKLVALCQTNEENWDEFLPAVVHAYNTGIHASTGYSPSFLIFGREVPLAFDPARPIVQLTKASAYVEHLAQCRNVFLRAARDNTIRQQQQTKQRYDHHRSSPIFEPGQLVLITRRGTGNKFSESRVGPYRILSKVGNSHLTYLVKSDHTSGVQRVHVNDMVLLDNDRF